MFEFIYIIVMTTSSLYFRKKRSPNVIYLPAPGGADGQPIYQEVYGDGVSVGVGMFGCIRCLELDENL